MDGKTVFHEEVGDLLQRRGGYEQVTENIQKIGGGGDDGV
jgi:hypothetical protein